LKDNSADKAKHRVAVAHSHSWENSVGELYKAIGQVVNK